MQKKTISEFIKGGNTGKATLNDHGCLSLKSQPFLLAAESPERKWWFQTKNETKLAEGEDVCCEL